MDADPKECRPHCAEPSALAQLRAHGGVVALFVDHNHLHAL